MKKLILRGTRGIVLGLSLLFFLFLTVVSLVSTTYFERGKYYLEKPEYCMDFLPAHLIFIALVLTALLFMNRKQLFDKLSVKVLAAVVVIFVTAVSILWVRVSYAYPEADQKAVSWMAYLMSQDNFLFFEPGKYMQVYPNQLGLTAALEALYRLTGGENWNVFRYLTAMANGAVVYFLYKITDSLFHSKETDCLVLLGSAGCIQIILYTTFLYGITLGLAFALAAFYLLLVFLKKNQIFYAAAAGILIGISVLVKNNYSIFLVGRVVLLLYKKKKKKNLKPLIAAVILIVFTAALSAALTFFYEKRSGIELGSGMPKALWIAMGMQEGERGEGWYNDFNFDTYLNTGCDEEESEKIAQAAIAESLKTFGEDPVYALNFYYKKTVSQWNEPTYEALWVNQFHMGEYSKIVMSIYDGKISVLLEYYMNLFQSLVFTAVVFALWRRRKNWSMEQLFLILVILGGFLFHTLWEAKSQYIFPYFVCMLPCAAVGISDALEALNGKWNLKRTEEQ